jgi:hypothetical protein
MFLYVDDFRNSQETHIRASTACYRDSFTSFTSKRTSVSSCPQVASVCDIYILSRIPRLCGSV